MLCLLYGAVRDNCAIPARDALKTTKSSHKRGKRQKVFLANLLAKMWIQLDPGLNSLRILHVIHFFYLVVGVSII